MTVKYIETIAGPSRYQYCCRPGEDAWKGSFAYRPKCRNPLHFNDPTDSILSIYLLHQFHLSEQLLLFSRRMLPRVRDETVDDPDDGTDQPAYKNDPKSCLDFFQIHVIALKLSFVERISDLRVVLPMTSPRKKSREFPGSWGLKQKKVDDNKREESETVDGTSARETR